MADDVIFLATANENVPGSTRAGAAQLPRDTRWDDPMSDSESADHISAYSFVATHNESEIVSNGPRRWNRYVYLLFPNECLPWYQYLSMWAASPLGK